MRDKLFGIIFMFTGAAMLALCLAMVIDVAAKQMDADNERAAIQAVLQAQADAWNRGDLDQFMAGYQRSDQLTFYAGGDQHLGWEAALQRYRNRYQKDGQSMGTLRFVDLNIDLVGPESALVRGRYLLATEANLDQGLFTLILRKTGDGWRIVHDHTSQ